MDVNQLEDVAVLRGDGGGVLAPDAIEDEADLFGVHAWTGAGCGRRVAA